MDGLYIDTSALARVLLGEPDAPLITAALAEFDGHLSSRLLGVELRRVALREQMTAAVGTLDALHLATALALAERDELSTILTYGRQLAAGAAAHGLSVLAPS